MNGFVEGRSSAHFDHLVNENRSVLFQLALASQALEVVCLTELLRNKIITAIRGHSSSEIKAYFGIIESEEAESTEHADDFIVVGEQRSKIKHIKAAEKDNSASKCNFCGQMFCTTVRRHHCRKCLKLFCHNCANAFVDLDDEVCSLKMPNTYIDIIIYFLSYKITHQLMVCRTGCRLKS